MRKKILVVEDDAELAELVSYNLKRADFATGTARDGIEALKKARSIHPDLIVLDLMLPELDGLAVCEMLKRDPATASIPVIVLTAVSGKMAQWAGLEAGAVDYFTKPFSPKDLIARIRRELDTALAVASRLTFAPPA